MTSRFIAEMVVLTSVVYAGCGTIFAAAFLVFGVQRVDPNAVSARWWVRLIWLPGTVALWPLLARRWFGGIESPLERNAHRDLAAKGAAS